MRRELIIAGGVLVPFALLVAAGFYFTPGEPPHPDPLPLGGEAILVPRVTVVDAGAPPPAVLPPLPPPFAPELAAPLKAVLPEVQQCFVDQKLKQAHQVRVHFTPTRDGGFEQVQVDEQNPYLGACLEDVFAEVRWHPEGPETFAPAVHTFSFDPSPD